MWFIGRAWLRSRKYLECWKKEIHFNVLLIKMKIEKCVSKLTTYSKNFIIIIIMNILYYITLIYCSPSSIPVFQILIYCSPLYMTIQPEKASCFRATLESILHNPKSLEFGGQYNASLTDLTYSFSGMESILCHKM